MFVNGNICINTAVNITTFFIFKFYTKCEETMNINYLFKLWLKEDGLGPIWPTVSFLTQYPLISGLS